MFLPPGHVSIISERPEDPSAVTIAGVPTYNAQGVRIGARHFYTQSKIVFWGLTFVGGFEESDWGGSVFLDTTSATFINCVFRDNYAESGGAVFAHNSAGSYSFTNCTFEGNHVDNGPLGSVNVMPDRWL